VVLDIIKTVLPLVIFAVGALVVAVRLQSQVKELQKDMEELEKKQTYVSVVKLEAKMEQVEKNVTSLWNFTNSLRDRFNVTSK
jgi:chaperonin cofactor prefoldin|tara:strand:- start:265 stop:513 length:249 start_codon:yes stop_codon:yes gene_type:complete